MEEGTKKEVNDLKTMVRNWTDAYLRLVTSEGGDEYLLDDLQEEINLQLYPYIKRLFVLEYLTMEEIHEFWGYVAGCVRELEKEVKE